MDADIKNPVNSSIAPPPSPGGSVPDKPIQVPTQPPQQQPPPVGQQPVQPGPVSQPMQPPPQQQQPKQQPTAPSQPSLTPPVVTAKPRRFPKFALFFTILIVVTIAIWIGVGYLFFENRKIGSEDGETEITTTPTAIPTPTFSPTQIQIKNGDVVNQPPSGETTTLVSKGDYTSTGITGFASVLVSPDELSICFESWPPATKPALYYAKIDGSGVVEVGLNRKNCLWSADSKSLFYVTQEASSERVDIYKYTISSAEETNLTPETTSSRKYSIVGFSADGTKLICTYTDLETEEESSECEIDLETQVTSTPTPS